MFPYYANASQPVNVTGTNQFGQAYQGIASPRVLAEARAQLGCSSMTSAPLEDEGGDGTAGSHWEYMLFQVSQWPVVGCSALITSRRFVLLADTL